MLLPEIFGLLQRDTRAYEAKFMNRSVLTRKGFTLIEATIAMIVLSVATAAVILPFATGATMNMEGARRTIAAKLAADKLEEIQGHNFDDIEMHYTSDPLDGFGCLRDEMYTQILTDSIYNEYTRTISVIPYSVGGEPLWGVTVTIRYDGIEVLKMSRLIGP